jgi:hypothetical protein
MGNADTGIKTKAEPFDYFRETDALRKQCAQLIDIAGIAVEMERCARQLEPDYFEDRHLPPKFTAARREADKLLDAQKFQAYRQCKRDVIFRVADTKLRKELISIERQFRKLKLLSCQNDLADARRRLNAAAETSRHGGLFVPAVSSIAVILGWEVAYRPGTVRPFIQMADRTVSAPTSRAGTHSAALALLRQPVPSRPLRGNIHEVASDESSRRG